MLNLVSAWKSNIQNINIFETQTLTSRAHFSVRYLNTVHAPEVILYGIPINYIVPLGTVNLFVLTNVFGQSNDL